MDASMAIQGLSISEIINRTLKTYYKGTIGANCPRNTGSRKIKNTLKLKENM